MGRAGALRSIGARAFARGAAVVAFALATAACGTIENMMPDPRDFHLPEAKNYAPTSMSAFARPVTAKGKVGPADLVDAQGFCAGAAPVRVSNDAPPEALPTAIGTVALEMTECEVARALGPPEQAEIARTPQGARTVALTYLAGERAGIYRFVDGRLTSIERGPEPPPPVAKKPPPKKPKPPAPPA